MTKTLLLRWSEAPVDFGLQLSLVAVDVATMPALGVFNSKQAAITAMWASIPEENGHVEAVDLVDTKADVLLVAAYRAANQVARATRRGVANTIHVHPSDMAYVRNALFERMSSNMTFVEAVDLPAGSIVLEYENYSALGPCIDAGVVRRVLDDGSVEYLVDEFSAAYYARVKL